MKASARMGFLSDAAVLLAVGALCAASYYLWIDPSLEKARSKEATAQACRAEERRYRATRANRLRMRHTLEDLLVRLEQEGGGMPARVTVDQRIAKIASLAQAHGVVIEEVRPEELPPEGEYVESLIQFRARAGCEDFRRFLRSMERQMSFVDITHFSVGSNGGPAQAACSITWSVRMFSQADEYPTRGTSARGAPPASQELGGPA
jgi:Tfp pilus assembly protein PilO